jgi:UDP-N-acetylglucosamine 2-epimerase (non-hydrolysing)
MAGPVCFVIGARPNFMKAAPVHAAVRSRAPELETLVVHTGQHYDEEMSDVFVRELELPPPDVFLGVGSGSHAEQTARALVGVERVLAERRCSLTVVCGDVNSTLAGALASVKLAVPVAHVEAGLRSRDPTMPEEHNRRLTDHVSTLLFAHSREAVDNLAREGVDRGVHLVGNTMIDSLLRHLPRARSLRPWRELGLCEGEYGLVTLHRPALVDDERLMTETAHELVRLSHTAPLVFPVHPRTRARLGEWGLREVLDGGAVAVVEPLGYLAFLGLEAGARFVLTDSGGVQEETAALGVRCFTLRDTTERPVTVEHGTNTVLGAVPARIRSIPELLAGPARVTPIPLWDGRAGERVAEILVAFTAER